MKIELSKKQCIDIEWSILIAVDTVQQRYLKEKKIPDTPLTKNYGNYTITYKRREKNET